MQSEPPRAQCDAARLGADRGQPPVTVNQHEDGERDGESNGEAEADVLRVPHEPAESLRRVGSRDVDEEIEKVLLEEQRDSEQRRPRQQRGAQRCRRREEGIGSMALTPRSLSSDSR